MNVNKRETAILCENLIKIYKTKDIEVVALNGLDLKIAKGEVMAIIGSSGSGKSTLLNMLGGLDRPTVGKIIVCGKDLLKMADRQLIDYKRSTVGFVWQNNARNLIPYLTARENVEFPIVLSGSENKHERANELLDAVGLSRRKNSKLTQLSGGELQRAAIAIGLANKPQILLADEPTGSVDSKTSNSILDVFREVNEAFGVTVVIVTHDRQVASKVDRVVSIRDGRIGSEFHKKDAFELGGISHTDTHIELSVIDRTGRVQIPDDYIKALELGNESMVRVDMESGRIILSAARRVSAS